MGILLMYILGMVIFGLLTCLLLIVMAWAGNTIERSRQPIAQSTQPTEVHYHDHRQITVNNHPPEERHYHDNRQVTVRAEPSLTGGFTKALTGQQWDVKELPERKQIEQRGR